MKTWVKKTLSCFLAVLMTLSCCAVAVPNNWVSATDGSTVESDSAQPQLQEEGSEPVPPSTDSISEISTLSEEPVSVYAASDLIYKEGITRAEWLHNLAVIFEMTVEEDNYPDDYYADVTSDHPYYRDIMLTVEFGVINLPAGENLRPDEPADREFAASTLNYCLGFQLEEGAEYTYSDLAEVEGVNQDDVQIAINRGWFALNGGAFDPTATITNAELQGMITDAQQILDAEQIDENYQSSYTYQPGVIEVPQGTEVLIEDNIITIFGGNVSIQAGDVFVVYVNGLPLAYTASSVSEAAGTLTVTAQEQDVDDYLVSADAQGSVQADLSQFVPAEGVEIDYEAYEAAQASARISGSSSLGNLPLSITLDLGSGLKTTLSCTLSDMKIEYEVNTSRVYVVLDGVMTTSLNLTANLTEMAGFNDTVPLGRLPVMGIGEISVVANIDFGGSVTFQAVNNFRAGFNYTPGSGFRTIMSFQKQSFTICAEVHANIGVTARAGLVDMPLVHGYVYARAGVRGGYDYQTYDDGNLPNSCGTFYAYLYAEVGVSAGINIPHLVNENFNKNIDFWDRNNSPVRVVYHYEDGVLVPYCTRGNSLNYFTWGGSRYGLPYGSSYGYGKDAVPFTIYEYELDDMNNATITGYNGNVSAISIPSTLDGHPVVAIGSRVFEGRTELVSVIIPTGVTRIDSRAFRNCTSLTYLELPSDSETIGSTAFENTVSLRSLTIPKTVVSASQAFLNSGLRKVNFEEGITKIPSRIMEACTQLEQISIPDTVTSIESQAFYGCSSLTYAPLPDSITRILNSAFDGCAKLSNVELPSNLTLLERRAFGGCTSLTHITIPKSLSESGTTYYYYAIRVLSWKGPFTDSGLSDVSFEDGVTKIVDGLFIGCTNLTQITIPDTVTTIGDVAFAECTNLTSVAIPNSVSYISWGAFESCTGLTSITFGTGLTDLGPRSFARAINLSEVKLPVRLERMGCEAFLNCSSLETITIPKTFNEVYTAYDGASHHTGAPFEGTVLQNITLEEGISILPYRIFSQCDELTSIQIPISVVEIGNYAFAECDKLETLTLPEKLETMGNHVFEGCSTLTSISVPDTVTAMGTYIFAGCTSLVSANLPEGLVNITEGIFQNCTNLKEIVIPDTVQYIRPRAFEGSGIQRITLPDSVMYIEDYAFCSCANLETVQLSRNLNSIDEEAFRYCSALTAIEIPAVVDEIGTYCFADCINLSSVTFEDGLLTTIPTGAFYQCPVLTELRLPYSVTSIGNSAFANCTGLTGITIPRRVESISTSAFSYPDRMTIYGVEGTYAQTFAEENGYTFVAKAIPAQSIEMASEMTVSVGGSNTLLTRTVTPEDYTDEVVWRSSDTSIATVTDTGLVTGRAPGTVTIRVNIGDASASCRVTVVQPVTSISITSSISLEALETRQISCTVRPNNANNKGVTWTSSDETVATVDENGVVTGLKKGTATITATAQDGSRISDTCTVTVTNTVYQAQTVAELESAHNYDNNCSDVWVYTLIGATSLSVTFDSRTEMEEDFDYLLVYDGEGNQIGRYTGKELAGATITVPGDTLRIQMDSDEGGTAWGFKVLSVVGDGATTEPVLTGISVNTLPYKTVYTVGEAFDPAGLTLTAYYSDGSSQTISQGYTLSTPDLNTAGGKIITVSYLGQEASFTIQVKEETISPVEQDFNQDGIVDVLDVMVLAQSIVNSSTLPSMNSDLNQDGIVDVLDVMTLAQYIVNN